MKKGKISQEDKQIVLELFADGMEFAEIAKQVDRSESFIAKLVSTVAEEEIVETDEVEVVNATPESVAKKKPMMAKTQNGKSGIAVSTTSSSEKVDSVNRKVSKNNKRGKINNPSVFRIFKD